MTQKTSENWKIVPTYIYLRTDVNNIKILGFSLIK